MNFINIDFKENEAKYISIYKHIKNLIIQGVVKEHEKLPSRRILQGELGLSPNTINNAYNLLLEEGYIYSIEKSGYYISPYKNYQNKEIIEKEEMINETYKYDFTSESIDHSLFPYYTLKKITQDIMLNNEKIWLSKSPYQGDNELRKTIARYLFENKGMKVSASNIVIVSSLEESLEIISTLFSIKKVALEDPLYKKVYSFFKEKNLSIKLCSIDKEGIVLPKEKDIDLLYVTPYNQFPLGIKMSNDRRKALLSFPSKYIFEDDFDCDLISRNKFMSTLYSLNNEKIIYHGSFSHTFCPGIRISYLVLPSSLISHYNEKYSKSSSRISSLDQAILSRFIQEGYYNRHIGKLKKSLNRKKDIITTYLQKHQIPFQETELSFILYTNKDTKILKKHLLDASIKIHFIGDFCINKSDNRLILSYISIDENILIEGLDILKNILI